MALSRLDRYSREDLKKEFGTLITSTTVLNKLKWGNDRFNAGMTDGSNQPYITTDIPGVNVVNPNPTLFNDGEDLPAKTGIDVLLRNGFRAPIEAATDVSRLFKMFTDTRSPNGILFTAAQNVLSRTAVKTEASFGVGYGRTKPPDFLTGKGGGALNAGIYLPSSTLAQAGIGFLGTHLNLMGLDPTSPMSGIVEGSLSGAGLNTYFETIRAKNSPATFSTKTETYTAKISNPIYEVVNSLPLILGSEGQTSPEPMYIDVEKERIVTNDQSDFDNRLTNLLDAKINIKTNDVNIISYSGGPGSISGVGSTNIRFADQRTGINNPLYVKDPGYFLGDSGKDHYNLSPQSNDFVGKLKASLWAQKLFRTKEDRDEILGFSTNEEIKKENITQSTINNAKLPTGFLGDLKTNTPNNYELFKRPNASPESIKIKKSIFNSGVSSQFMKAFPPSTPDVFANLTIDTDGSLQDWKSSVYQGNLVSIGRNVPGKQWNQNTWTFTQAQLEAETSPPINSPLEVGIPPIQDFRTKIIKSGGITTSTVLSLAPNYNTKSANNRINRGDPGKKINVFNYAVPAYELEASDLLTALPLYNDALSVVHTDQATQDFVKFRIAAINNDNPAESTFIHFRAFIDSFSDAYSAEWNPVKYVGRGESLYNYGGFGRGINMSFTCYAQSKAELIPMYTKLNYLASTLAPDYTNAGFMRGNLVKLTMGGYLYEQPGFITSLTYEIPQETTWEIAINATNGDVDPSVKELPHMIRVTGMQFTPIHTFLPQKVDKYDAPTGPDERYIALSDDALAGNYIDEYDFGTPRSVGSDELDITTTSILEDQVT